jgi:hypothetical protein
MHSPKTQTTPRWIAIIRNRGCIGNADRSLVAFPQSGLLVRRHICKDDDIEPVSEVVPHQSTLVEARNLTTSEQLEMEQACPNGRGPEIRELAGEGKEQWTDRHINRRWAKGKMGWS